MGILLTILGSTLNKAGVRRLLGDVLALTPSD